MPRVPTRFERIQISARALVDERIVRKYFVNAASVRPASAAQIRLALAELNIPDPHARRAFPAGAR